MSEGPRESGPEPLWIGIPMEKLPPFAWRLGRAMRDVYETAEAIRVVGEWVALATEYAARGEAAPITVHALLAACVAGAYSGVNPRWLVVGPPRYHPHTPMQYAEMIDEDYALRLAREAGWTMEKAGGGQGECDDRIR